METCKDSLNMRDGLRDIKRVTQNRLTEHGKCGVLISGYPGSGKTTLVKLLAETGFGGLIDEEITYNGEISYRSLLDQQDLFRSLFDISVRHSDLFVADVAGAGKIQESFGSDPRIVVVSLYCNFSTRFLNLIGRIPSRMTIYGESESIWKNAMYAVKSLQDELWPDSEIRQSVRLTRADMIVNTSIFSRLGIDAARRVLYES